MTEDLTARAPSAAQRAILEYLERSECIDVPTGMHRARLLKWSHPGFIALGALVIAASVGFSAGHVQDWSEVQRSDELLVIAPRGADWVPLIWITMTVWVGLMSLARLLGGATSVEGMSHVVGEYALRVPVVLDLMGLVTRIRGANFRPALRRLFFMLCMCATGLVLIGWNEYRRVSGRYYAATVDGVRAIESGTETFLPWEGLRGIEVGCDHKRRRLTYWLTFKNGRRFNLLREDEGGEKIVQSLDRIFRELHVPVDRLTPSEALACQSSTTVADGTDGPLESIVRP